jgi:hypothetical protein
MSHPPCHASIACARRSLRRLGCNAELIVDEFGEKLLEELDYVQEARNIQVPPAPPPFLAWLLFL